MGAVAAMKAGTKMAEITREFAEAYVKWGRGLRDLRLLIGQQPRNFKTEVCVLIGPPEGGKSRWAASRRGHSSTGPAVNGGTAVTGKTKTQQSWMTATAGSRSGSCSS